MSDSSEQVVGGVFERMSAHLEEVTIELFGSYDFTVQAAAQAVDASLCDRSCVAIIGFASDKMRGALILLASNAAIGRWMPAFGAAPGEESDVLGECSNMLLGRLKGRLLGEGLTILLSTPTTTIGNALQLSSPLGRSRSQSYVAKDWAALTRLDATFDEGFVLHNAAAAAAGAVFEAGEAMLF